MEEVLKPPKASAPASVRRYLPLGLNEAEALSQGKPPSRPQLLSGSLTGGHTISTLKGKGKPIYKWGKLRRSEVNLPRILWSMETDQGI